MPKYRLAIEDRVAVRIRGKVPGAEIGKHTNIDFVLDMERISQTKVTELAGNTDSMQDVLVARTRGWSGQRLVIDEETGQPASYNEDAMRALLDFPGMAPFIWAHYLRELGLQEKN